jgi:hypothetical protein
MRLIALLIAALSIFASTTAIAAAEEITELKYTETVEPICHKSSTAIETTLKKVKKEIKHSELKKASGAVKKAAADLSSAYSELVKVAPPTASEATINRWLEALKKTDTLTSQTAAALKANKKSKASNLEGKVLHESNAANTIVFSFHFHYCHSELSRYI